MTKETPYGDALIEIENGLWEQDYRVDEEIAAPYSYTHDHFRACLKIFMNSLLWKMWEKMEGEATEKKAASAEKLGNKIRELIFEFTGIDTSKL